MNQACTKEKKHIYCNGSLFFSNMAIKNNIKDNYKLNIPYILVLVIMSSSLKTRGEGKTAETEFSRGGIPKVASHYSHFSLSYRISQLSKTHGPLFFPQVFI